MFDESPLLVVIDGDDLDADERADLGQQLRMALLDVDLAEVDTAEEDHLPPGAKSGAALAFGALAVSLAPEAISQVIGVITSWLRRQRTDIEVEIDGQRLHGEVTRAQRDAIVAAYLTKVGAGQN